MNWYEEIAEEESKRSKWEKFWDWVNKGDEGDFVSEMKGSFFTILAMCVVGFPIVLLDVYIFGTSIYIILGIFICLKAIPYIRYHDDQ